MHDNEYPALPSAYPLVQTRSTGCRVSAGVSRHRALRSRLFDLPGHAHGESSVRQAAAEILVSCCCCWWCGMCVEGLVFFWGG